MTMQWKAGRKENGRQAGRPGGRRDGMGGARFSRGDNDELVGSLYCRLPLHLPTGVQAWSGAYDAYLGGGGDAGQTGQLGSNSRASRSRTNYGTNQQGR